VSKKQIMGIIVSCPLLCLIFSSLLIRAQDPLPPNPDFASALWVARSEGINKVATHDASPLLQIPGLKNVRAITVDEQHGILWAYIQNTLWAYQFNGKPAFSIPLTPHGDKGDSKEVALSANPKNGSVWLGVKKSLYHFGPHGQWLNIHSLSEPVQALAWDPTTSCLWVGTQKTVTALDNTGRLCNVINLGKHPEVQDLAVDPDSGDLWVAMKKTLLRYDARGTLEFEADLEKMAYLSPDHHGGVWIATGKNLLRMDRSGLILVDIEPHDHSDKIVALVSDPVDSSVWVASKKRLSHIGSAGHPLQQLDFNEEIRDLALYVDVFPPGIAFTAPEEGASLNINTPMLEIQYHDNGSGIDPETMRLQVNGVIWSVTCRSRATGASCTPNTGLPEGVVTLTATVEDFTGNTSEAAETRVTIDTIPPVITLTSPPNGATTNQPQHSFVGSLSEPATLTLNGEEVRVEPNLSFSHGTVALQEGLNILELIATDAAANSRRLDVRLVLDTVSPATLGRGAVEVDDVGGGQIRVSGKAGSVEDAASVAVTNIKTGQTVTVQANSEGGFEITITAQSGDILSIVTVDMAGNASSPHNVEVQGVAPSNPNTVPPDPSSVAPSLDRTVATDFAAATAFLYSGTPPIQTGVAAGAIEPRRISVLRGQVTTRDGAPLSGVTITILGHAEYGQTLTRADGMFDMAINGGGLQTVRYEKAGYLPVQRQVQAPWRDYAWLPGVIMLPYDERVTTIDLATTTDMQVAQGSIVADESGTRQAMLLFAPETEATMVLPDGTTQPLTTLHVRASEYTVGPNGPKAMPGTLPSTSAYTYAVELSVDEAVAAGATAVQFTQPVLFYVQNFLDFPVGGIVPSGYYDRTRGAWVPSDNGHIIKILEVTGGLATLDINGDTIADDESALTTLGITEPERQRLAALYQPGQSLWRVPISHFTPWDCNWPFGPPPDAEAPKSRRPKVKRALDKPTCQAGSLIECENQILGEAVALNGTPFSLHYRSDRVPGRRASRTLDIALSGPSVPASLRRIDLEIDVAGRHWSETFPNTPQQTYTFVWDGRDAYGRFVEGTQVASIRLGYVHTGAYQQPRPIGSSFGASSGLTITGSRTRQEVTLWQQWSVAIGPWDGRGLGLGGWSLAVHHVYDVAAGMLYKGDGSRSGADALDTIITTVAGNGTYGDSGDGGPATQAQLAPLGIAVGSDGSLYIADVINHRIRRMAPDGRIATVAGDGSAGYGGDGGPATQAQLTAPLGVAVGPNDDFYFIDSENNRVRRVDPGGRITTVAGNGSVGNSGDGGPAILARLAYPRGVAVGPDGSLYIADTYNHRIRRVDPNGIMTTVAGNGTYGRKGDGGPATAGQLTAPIGVAVGADGSLYIAEAEDNNRVRRVGPDGIMTTVAGSGVYGDGGDGGPAIKAQLSEPGGIALGRDGSLYIADTGNHRLRWVGADGIITTVAGTDISGYAGDGGPASAAVLSSPQGVAVAPDGSLYIADSFRVRRVGSIVSDRSLHEVLIPAENGSDLYIFDPRGQHLRTLDPLTGAMRYQFRYDDSGLLIQIEDGNGNVTTIERDTVGNPLAIVAPFGQRTSLSLDGNGYLASLVNPAGETARFTYTADGLLTHLIDPRSNQYHFNYDPLGQLLRDEDPVGGFKALARSDSDTGFTVSLTTRMGRTSTYQVERPATRGMRRVSTDPRGLSSITTIGTDGSLNLTAPDGTITTLVEAPDPRFGMQAPLVRSFAVTTPSGLAANVSQARTVTLSDPQALLSLTSLTDTVTINGRSSTSIYDATSKTITNRTPMGRQMVSTLDEHGRVLVQRIAGLEPLRYTYDGVGQLVTVAQGLRQTLLGYDGRGRLSSVTDPLGRTAGFGYDAVGRITTQVLPDGREVLFSYDANGNVTSITPPGRPSHAFAYSAIDLEERYLPPEVGDGSNLTHSTYNWDHQLVEMARPDGTTVGLGYDQAGRPSTLRLPRGQLAFGYHPATGNLTAITDPDGGTLSYDYDGSLLTRETWAGIISGNIQYTYDHNFRLISQSVNGDSSLIFRYDEDSLLTQVGTLTFSRDSQIGHVTGSTLGHVVDARVYNGFGELSNYRATFGGNDILAVQYTRDQLGRILQKTETVEGESIAYSYTYDVAGRLTEVQRNGSTIATYAYDTNGNRLSYTSPDGTLNGAYDLQDRLLRYGSSTYSYTANGELRHKTAPGQTTTYDYDALGNLRAVLLPDGKQIEYVIDGRNRRVGKKINGVLLQGFLYDGDLRPVAELDGRGQITARFIYGTRGNVPDYMVKGGITYRIISDHLGGPRLVVDATTGHVAQRTTYDGFGKVTFDDNPGFQPFGFAGGLYDPDTRLTRFGARDYDAETGRWTAKDPIRFAGGDTNLYGYVLNDPVNWIDPTGLVLDTVADIAFIAYDVYRLVKDNVAGDCDNLGTNLTALGGDVVSALTPFAVGLGASMRSGTLVIGKLNDLHKPGALKHGERILSWPNLGTTAKNWGENSSLLREAMRERRPIRDASVNPMTGALRDNTGLLRAERNLLDNQGWKYNPKNRHWHPPGH
jgi:RHS repeat-associated protein